MPGSSRPPRPARREHPILEHLTGLDELPDGGPVRLTALPAPVRGMGTFPVRAVAVVG